MNQAQTALISALTAAVVTVLIEYAAKPRLEARKERIIEQTRERRKLMSRLLSMSMEISHLGALGRAGPAVTRETAIASLNEAYKEFSSIAGDFSRFYDLLNKRQRTMVRTMGRSILQQIMILIHLVEMEAEFEESNPVDSGSKNRAQPFKELIGIRILPLMEAFAVLYAVLVQRRWKIFVYRKRMREFDGYQAKIDATMSRRDNAGSEDDEQSA